VAITGFLYGSFFQNCCKKLVNCETDIIRVTLHTASYVPQQDTHDFVDDLTNEVVGTGYTAGGLQLTPCTLTYTAATNKLKMTAPNVSWANSTITASVVVVSDRQSGVNSTSPLILYQVSDTPIVSSGGPFDIQWNASGLWELTVS